MENQTTTKTHYNKHELNLFKEPATRKLKIIKRAIRDLTKEYYAADDERKSEFYNELLTAAQSYNAIKRQLAKIHYGTFGICRVTGKLIPKERLRLLFHIWPNTKISDPHPNFKPKSFSSVLRDWFIYRDANLKGAEEKKIAFNNQN